jgi:hypothetical protein
MKTIHLKTATKEDMEAALKAVLKVDEEGELITSSKVYFIDVCGVLKKPTGVMLTDDGNEYPEKIAIDGYHANLRTRNKSIITALKPITILNVKNPLAKISGDK